MKLRLVLVSTFVAALVLAGLGAAGTPPPAPAVQLLKASPLTLQGVGFRAHASLRLAVRTGTHLVVRNALVGSKGGFVAVFPSETLDPCSGMVTVTTPAGKVLIFKFAGNRMCASRNPG